MRCNMCFGSCVMLGSVFACRRVYPMWCSGVSPGRAMSFSGQSVARGSQDPTVCGRVSAQRNDLQVTSALPEPDSLLTQMALVTEESRDGRLTGRALVRNWSGHLT